MAAAFRPVNSPLASEAATTVGGDVMTPSPVTPRPSTAPHPGISKTADDADDATTPTRNTFSPSIAGQQPLPSSPFAKAAHQDDTSSQTSSKLRRRDSMDVDMDESDGEPAGADDGAASDDESVGGDGSRSNKKKKSQRFYCTDYPPCNLSFTRSEHLARHIRFVWPACPDPTRRVLTVCRKHTGERPFQCHCSRRFSRLDNLRQHAQTVHVNEDIPIDSLAATGSRFQRQMRTDRVRQAGNRARASTGGSAGGPPRGHSKSLSTSSINSISSVGSSYTTAADARRRPPPLVMADPRSRPMDLYRSNPDGSFQYRPPSPSEFSTPTSATFSTGQGSPRWTSGVASPATSHSRSQSMYTATRTRTTGRRLSVPSAANPFQSNPTHVAGRPMFSGAGPMNSSNNGSFSPANSSMVTSPTASNASGWSGRRDSTSSTTEEAWRRRTWHSDSRSYNQNHHPSQLSNVANQSSMGPNPPPPIANPSNTQSSLQLPGIESFDQPSSRGPLTPPRRHPSPMMVDSQPRPPVLQQRDPSAPEDRRNLNVYDASLQRGLTRLDIGPNTPPRDSAGAWASEANKAVQAQTENARVNAPVVRFEDQQPPSTSYHHSGGPAGPGRSLHQQTMSAPSIATSRENKRRGWYNGPLASQRDEGQRPSHDPRVPHVDRMVHPNFTGFSGFPAREPQQPPPQQPPQHQHQQQQQQQQERPVNGGDPLRRLEALVAVATSEGSTATAY